MMMIRINLLPVRQVKKREMGRQILVLAAGILVATIAGNYSWYSSRSAVQEKGAGQLKAVQAQIAELQTKIGEVDKLNARKREVEQKLSVLATLKAGRSGPVKMMDALATALPKKVWLKTFNEKDQKVKIEGSALSHEDVADLMRSLTSIVWTPRGLGRLVEQKRDAKTSRVELTSGEGTIEEFAVNEVKFLFANVDLKKAEQTQMKADKAAGASTAPQRAVDFEIAMTTNYAI